MKDKMIGQHPLLVGQVLERNLRNNAHWIKRGHRREKWKSLWLSLGIIAGAAMIYWLWQPLRVPPINPPNGEIIQKPSIEVTG